MNASLFLLISILLSLYSHSNGIEFNEGFKIEFEKQQDERHPIWYMHYKAKGEQSSKKHISYDPIKGEPVYLMVSAGEYYEIPLGELVKKKIKGAPELQKEIADNKNKHATSDPFTEYLNH